MVPSEKPRHTNGQTPGIDEIHETIFKEAGAKVVDGEMPSISKEIAEGERFSFKNYTILCPALWAITCSVAAAPLQGLFDILRSTHRGPTTHGINLPE